MLQYYDYQHDFRVLNVFFPINHLVSYHIFHQNVLCFLKFLILSFHILIEKWFTDQSFKLIERERKINITSVINLSVTYKKITCISVEPGDRIFVKNINFRFLLKIWVKT